MHLGVAGPVRTRVVQPDEVKDGVVVRPVSKVLCTYMPRLFSAQNVFEKPMDKTSSIVTEKAL